MAANQQFHLSIHAKKGPEKSRDTLPLSQEFSIVCNFAASQNFIIKRDQIHFSEVLQFWIKNFLYGMWNLCTVDELKFWMN